VYESDSEKWVERAGLCCYSLFEGSFVSLVYGGSDLNAVFAEYKVEVVKQMPDNLKHSLIV
jgi:hypothetical protein